MLKFQGHYIFKYNYDAVIAYGAIRFKYGLPMVMLLYPKGSRYCKVKYSINFWPRRSILRTRIDDVLTQICLSNNAHHQITVMTDTDVAVKKLSDDLPEKISWVKSDVNQPHRNEISKFFKVSVLTDET